MTRIIAYVVLTLVVTGQVAKADWPFYAKDGLRRGSPEYYQARASDPPGSRQVYKAGKLWPPIPRPTGPEQTFIHKYHHNHYWPLPYVCNDRAAVHEHMNVQVANGWREAATLQDYHFTSKGELNSAGHRHLVWMVNSVPAEFQQLNVVTALDPEVNLERNRSIQQALAQMPDVNSELLVQSRYAVPVGRPASEVQWIFKSAQESALPVALPPREQKQN